MLLFQRSNNNSNKLLLLLLRFSYKLPVTVKVTVTGVVVLFRPLSRWIWPPSPKNNRWPKIRRKKIG